jgi:hypothetical protein
MFAIIYCEYLCVCLVLTHSVCLILDDVIVYGWQFVLKGGVKLSRLSGSAPII